MVTPNFGQGNITYSWSHDAAETGPIGGSICEQVILVSAVDENGCSDQDIISVEIPEIELFTFTTDPSCFGFSDGTVAAVATGGLGGEFDFEWDNAQGEEVGDEADVIGKFRATGKQRYRAGMDQNQNLGPFPPKHPSPMKFQAHSKSPLTTELAKGTFMLRRGPSNLRLGPLESAL